MTEALAAKMLEIAEECDIAVKRYSGNYGGRWAFGKGTVALVLECREDVRCLELETCADTLGRDFLAQIKKLHTDNLGQSFVVY